MKSWENVTPEIDVKPSPKEKMYHTDEVVGATETLAVKQCCNTAFYQL